MKKLILGLSIGMALLAAPRGFCEDTAAQKLNKFYDRQIADLSSLIHKFEVESDAVRSGAKDGVYGKNAETVKAQVLKGYAESISALQTRLQHVQQVKLDVTSELLTKSSVPLNIQGCTTEPSAQKEPNRSPAGSAEGHVAEMSGDILGGLNANRIGLTGLSVGPVNFKGHPQRY